MEVSHIKDFEHNPISDQLLESMEASKKIADSLAPILEQEEKLKRIAEGATAHIPNFEIPTLALDAISEPSPAMKAIAEQSKAMKLATSVGTAIDALQHSSTIQTLGELAIAANVPNYTFKNPLLEQASLGMTAMLQSFNNSAVKLLADSVHGIINSFGSALTAAIHSPVMDWLQSIDISPMRSVLENLALEPDILGRYKKFNQAYLTAMYECKWFPYAGWAADITMTAEISDILATSRGASKRREKRIDKVILDYYDKNEIKFIKRIWRESDLEPHIKRILGQALEAHLRGEYALCISSLATMWEGLIYIKANNATMQDRHRQRMEITKKELEDLTEANDYDKIFSDYFNTFKGAFTDGDRVLLTALRDKLMGDKNLASMARTSDPQIFVESIFPKAFGDAAMESYTESQDTYTSLFEDQNKYNAIMSALAEVIYREMRKKK